MKYTLIILALRFVFYPAAFAQTSLMPPPDSRIEKIDGQDFASGEVYLTAHADTALLKEFGFRNFKFAGRSVGTVKYHAQWPLAAVASQLPAQLSGLDYDPFDAGRTCWSYATSSSVGLGYKPLRFPKNRLISSSRYHSVSSDAYYKGCGGHCSSDYNRGGLPYSPLQNMYRERGISPSGHGNFGSGPSTKLISPLMTKSSRRRLR